MPYVDPEKAREYRRRWDQKHRAEYQRKYRALHGPEKRSEAQKERDTARYWALRARVFDLVGRICARCGFSDERALQIDHLNGGGRAEIRSFTSAEAYYRAILDRAGAGYQTLCANCDSIKRVENGESLRKRPLP